MFKAGADKHNIFAKIIGGAMMFKMPLSRNMGNIGQDNIIKVKKILKEQNIKIVAEDLGGDFARTIDFFLDNGEVKIKTNNRQVKII